MGATNNSTSNKARGVPTAVPASVATMWRGQNNEERTGQLVTELVALILQTGTVLYLLLRESDIEPCK